MMKNLIKKIKCLSSEKIIGTLFLIAGAVLLVCFLPGWVWGAILGIAIIATGCFLLLP